MDYDLEFDIKVGESGKVEKDIGNGTTIEFGYTDEEEDRIDKIANSILNVQYYDWIESILHYDSINKSKGEITLTQKFKLTD